MREWREAVDRVGCRRGGAARSPATLIVIGIVLPFFFAAASGFLNATIIAVAYAVMALGLNIVVGFAGLLDLGYVAFYALGAYSWAGSARASSSRPTSTCWSPRSPARLPGIHLNFLLILVAAALICALAGMLIGLPTLRLRGDYIAIVTLAFGEIIGVVAVNGTSIHLGGGMTLTAGNSASARRLAVLPGDRPVQRAEPETLVLADLRLLLLVLFVNLRLRDSRLGRAWVALREDEVAAVSMGIPLVRTKLLAYAIGAAFGGMAGAFLGTYYTVVNAEPVPVRLLDLHPRDGDHRRARLDLGRGGRRPAARLHQLLPDPGRAEHAARRSSGSTSSSTEIEFGIYGFLLVIVMVLRPQGLIPERRRRLEMTGRGRSHGYRAG